MLLRNRGISDNHITVDTFGDNIEMRRVDELHPHPRQAVHFSDQPAAQFAEFVEDIRINGIRVPIEILPDGTIVSGHQRRRAAIRLNWEEVPVRVRHDLADAGDDAVELELIEQNRNRRQLSKLEQARCYKRVREIKEAAGEKFSRGKLRDVYAKRFNMSGRNLDRYVKLLDHPKELQDAVDAKKISLVKALRLMELDADDYEPILEKLRDGQDVRRDVNAILPGVPVAPLTDKKFERLWRGWLWQADQFGQDLGRLAKATKRHTMVRLRSQHVERLRTAQTLVQAMLELLEADDDQPDVGDDVQDTADAGQGDDVQQDDVDAEQVVDSQPLDEDDGDDEPDASDDDE